MKHEHKWYKLYEDSILGIGPSLIAWKCSECEASVSPNEITPAGIGGTVLNEQRLIGPHGCRGQCSDGSTYKEQIFRDGKLEIIR